MGLMYVSGFQLYCRNIDSFKCLKMVVANICLRPLRLTWRPGFNDTLCPYQTCDYYFEAFKAIYCWHGTLILEASDSDQKPAHRICLKFESPTVRMMLHLSMSFLELRIQRISRRKHKPKPLNTYWRMYCITDCSYGF